MLSRFFIDRPIFAWVVALVVMLAGVLAITSLPIAQYPTIAPPAIAITATYPGADARTLENTVTQVVEQQMKGLDHLEYMSSSSDAGAGIATITLTFAQGTNPDIAQVQVENKLQTATPLLPQQVQQQGLTVTKAAKNFLLVLAAYSKSGKMSGADMGDLVASKLQDPISRVNGVGDTQELGSQYAIRIWLDPYKLNSYKLTTGDIRSALQAQDAQVSAGQVGGLPAVKSQALNAIVTAQSRLQTPEEFADIIVRTNPDGSTVRVRDVARVERAADSYTLTARYNGHPAAGFGIKLASGANALATVDAVKQRVAELQQTFPEDVGIAYPYDTTPFVRLSIEDVVKTLLEAIVLVFGVMYLFLQNWRVTLIPTIAVPVVLLGTFAVLAAFGYSINTLTMFAMVLAIGLLVDDAIVVVENVERIMRDEGLSPKEATRKSMDEITGALIGIATVLSAVFVPMAFFGGSVGVIYRQFSVTIVSAMALSVLVAVIVTPALCATLLKPIAKGTHHAERGLFGWFNRNFDRGLASYQRGLTGVLARPARFMLIYGAIVVVMGVLLVHLPSAFFPDEDQGVVYASYQLPPGAPAERTVAVSQMIEKHFLVDEKADVDGILTVSGYSFGGDGQNNGLAFIHLKDWNERKGAQNHAPAIVKRAQKAFAGIRDAMVFAFVPPPVKELGNASGFDMELKDLGGVGHAKLMAARNQLLGMAAKDPKLMAVRPNGQNDTPQLKLDVDRNRAGALGLSLADVNDTLSTAWGSAYVDDFIDDGRVKHVYLQGDAPYRSRPEDFDRWYVRGASGAMAPFSSFASTHWTFGSPYLERYNGLPAVELLGASGPGQSSGTAMAEMEKLVAKLPHGIGYEWTGLSYEEKASGSQAGLLYAISMVIVFLCLAALYESWSVPISVMLVVPLGIVGALLAATTRGLANDVYFQVGLLTTIGLSAKNAILIVEFAEAGVRSGMGALAAAMEAARLRLRPILMTSLAFVAGVAPLAVASGAGSGSQNDIGTGVIGGMISATVFAIFFVPLFFIVVRRFFPVHAAKAEAAPDALALQPEEA